MKYLTVKSGGQPEMRTKSHYGGDITDSKVIRKTCNLLITGAHHSGKSSVINRLYQDAEAIWSKQLKPYKHTNNHALLSHNKPVLKQGESLDDWVFPEPVFLSGITPLSKWTDHQAMKIWYEAKEEGNEYKKIPAWQRVELLPEYLSDTRAVLFVDDAHRLTGRKLQIVKSCIDSAFRVVLATSDENRLSPSIRYQFLESEPQIVRLNSDVAYDATHLLIWAMIAILALVGAPELAALLTFMEAMKGGRRASRQD